LTPAFTAAPVPTSAITTWEPRIPKTCRLHVRIDASSLPPLFHHGWQTVPKLVGAKDLTKDVLDDWYNYYHQCSECRRCSVFCPYGIDTAEITMAGREILNHIGMGQKYSNEILGKVQKIVITSDCQAPRCWIRLRVWKRTSRLTPEWQSNCRLM